jgi:hypothetical protein
LTYAQGNFALDADGCALIAVKLAYGCLNGMFGRRRISQPTHVLPTIRILNEPPEPVLKRRWLYTASAAEHPPLDIE